MKSSKVPESRVANPTAISFEDLLSDRSEENSSNQAQIESAQLHEQHTSGDNNQYTPLETQEITLNQSEPRKISTQSNPQLRESLNDTAGEDSQPNTPLIQEELTLLDAKIGDVNGKPIFTNSFFAPIKDRLIAEASTQPNIQGWRKAAAQIIAVHLDGMIADELLRAEALAALTPNQRVGLQAFLSNFRNNLLSENLGSSQLASRRLVEEQGQTLDEALKQKEIDTLVQLTLIKEINRRVNVSWRDIKQRYERDIDQYSPPPTAVFRVIRAFADDVDKIEQIKNELESGTPFVHLAAGPLNNFNRNADGMQRTIIESSYEETSFFGSDALNDATRQLSVGEYTGPIESGTTVWWIKLMDIEQDTISLYDAQLQISRALTLERRQEVQKEYLGRLMERAKISSRDDVFLRLVQIAESRYGPRS